MAAKAEKDPKTGKWLIQYRYTDWQGNRKKSMKRGFKTKREAEEWLQNFLATKQADFNMLFENFLKIYYSDMDTRLREHTMRTKKYVFELKILPYFGKMKMNEITASDIRKWQSELIKQGYAPTYLKTINNQLAALFNYAVRYYDLPRERIEQMVKFFEDNKFQVIYAAPPEKIDSIGSHINSTISLYMKGKYTWAVEGLVKLDEFKTE